MGMSAIWPLNFTFLCFMIRVLRFRKFVAAIFSRKHDVTAAEVVSRRFRELCGGGHLLKI